MKTEAIIEVLRKLVQTCTVEIRAEIANAAIAELAPERKNTHAVSVLSQSDSYRVAALRGITDARTPCTSYFHVGCFGACMELSNHGAHRGKMARRDCG